MRNISFMMTTKQFVAQEKTETRRLGWLHAKVGDVYMGVLKSQGLKKGEKIVRLHPIEVVHTRREPLRYITQDACVREGFPDKTPEEFIMMFMEHNRRACAEYGEDTLITVIRFKHLKFCPQCLSLYDGPGICDSCLELNFR